MVASLSQPQIQRIGREAHQLARVLSEAVKDAIQERALAITDRDDSYRTGLAIFGVHPDGHRTQKTLVAAADRSAAALNEHRQRRTDRAVRRRRKFRKLELAVTQWCRVNEVPWKLIRQVLARASDALRAIESYQFQTTTAPNSSAQSVKNGMAKHDASTAKSHALEFAKMVEHWEDAIQAVGRLAAHAKVKQQPVNESSNTRTDRPRRVKRLERRILECLNERGAFDISSCVSSTDIQRGIKDRTADYIRKVAGRMVKSGLLESHPENTGGYWLTEQGKKAVIAG